MKLSSGAAAGKKMPGAVRIREIVTYMNCPQKLPKITVREERLSFVHRRPFMVGDQIGEGPDRQLGFAGKLTHAVMITK
jgi:hypothetical protein